MQQQSVLLHQAEYFSKSPKYIDFPADMLWNHGHITQPWPMWMQHIWFFTAGCMKIYHYLVNLRQLYIFMAARQATDRAPLVKTQRGAPHYHTECTGNKGSGKINQQKRFQVWLWSQKVFSFKVEPAWDKVRVLALNIIDQKWLVGSVRQLPAEVTFPSHHKHRFSFAMV